MLKLTKSERFVSQATSARWILAVLAGLGFIGFTFTVSVILWSIRSTIKAEAAVAMFSALLLVIQGVLGLQGLAHHRLMYRPSQHKLKIVQVFP